MAIKVEELLYTNAVTTHVWPKQGIRIPGSICVARYAGQSTRILLSDGSGRPLFVFEVPDEIAEILTRFISEASAATLRGEAT